jgi:hypothetical protein
VEEFDLVVGEMNGLRLTRAQRHRSYEGNRSLILRPCMNLTKAQNQSTGTRGFGASVVTYQSRE